MVTEGLASQETCLSNDPKGMGNRCDTLRDPFRQQARAQGCLFSTLFLWGLSLGTIVVNIAAQAFPWSSLFRALTLACMALLQLS